MTKPIFAVALLSIIGAAYAADPKPSPSTDLKAHVSMHEKMSAAHEKAAKCLKEGKAHEECRAQFQESCRESGSQMGCGMGSGKGRGWGKGLKE